MKKESKVLFIVVACLIMFGSLIGCEAVSTVDSASADESVKTVVESTIVEAQQSEETTVVEEASTEESSLIEETTTTVTEESSIEESIQSSSEFTYTDWDGNVLTIEDMQEYLIDCDRALTVAEILELSPEDLVDRYDEVMVIEKAQEYDDYGQEGFWDEEEDSTYYINNIEDYKNWYRNAEEGDILCFTVSAKAEISKVFGYNKEIIVKIYENYNNYVVFYVDAVDGNIPNVMENDVINQLFVTYTGYRDSNNGYPVFECNSLTIK